MPTIGGLLPRKVTVRVGGRKQVFAQRAGESDRHILLKALVFALYQSQFPDMGVERNIGHRYKPDLVALGSDGTPLFWAECGEIGAEKLARLVHRFPGTHLVVAKLATDLTPWGTIIERALPDRRSAPIELLGFDSSAWDAIDERGTVNLSGIAIKRRRFPANTRPVEPVLPAQSPARY